MPVSASLLSQQQSGPRFSKDAPLNIIWPVLTALSLFVITYFWLLLPSLEGHLMDRKREMIRALTDSAWSTVHYYAEQADRGILTVETARKQAIDHLRHLRFGPEGKDYFWINDMQPRIIMHPYRPDLEGRDTTDLTDPAGKHLFVAFTDKVRDQGSGYVDYQWQWQDDPNRIVEKISYVKGFTPWGWVIGSGVYVEDVRDQIASITRHISMVCLGITAVMIVLSFYTIWQGSITERKRRNIEMSLKESEAKYRLLAETAREIIMTFDADYAITYANQAWTEIWPAGHGEIVGTSILDIVAIEHRPAFKEKVARASRGEMADYLMEAAFQVDAGAVEVPIEATLARMPGTEGECHYLLAARDITERKKAARQAQIHREQLYQSAKMASLGTLVSGVAHEVNNPISTVMLNVQTFEKFWHCAKPVLERFHRKEGNLTVGGLPYDAFSHRMPQLIRHTIEGVERVKRIVGDLKAFAGQNPENLKEDVDINEVVEKSAGLVASLIRKATVDFEVHCAADLPPFKGDAQRIEQVVINLLVNACQATEDRNRPMRITTGYEASRGALFIEVKDAGTGMPPEVLQRITDPFFTTKRNSGGTGLGLSISDTIIRDHGGQLEFETTVGQGTTAVVWLPPQGSTARQEKAP